MAPKRSLIAAGMVAAALIGPASASAGWYTIDENGNTTPAGHGSAPEGVASNGSSSSSSGGGYVMTEATTTTFTTGCNWTVRGRLIVRNPVMSAISDGDPVVGVQVKVSGRSATGAALGDLGYNEWGTDVTDASGEFSVAKTECSKRRVKIEARFESDDLRVLGPSSPGWYELHDTGDEIDPATLDVGGEPFGGDSGDQSTVQARTDAQTWILYRRAIDYVTDDVGYSFLNRTVVHNPATLAPNGSWTDPVLHDIHIAPQFTNSTWNQLHELGHAWAYPREVGEGCLTWAAISNGNTHDFQENPCVAFNEGFADFFASKLEQEMDRDGELAVAPPSTTPVNRADLVAQGLISLDRVSKNEWGWYQAFSVLTSADVTRQLYGNGIGNTGAVGTYGGASCTGRGVPADKDDLADALQAFGDAADQFDLQDSDDPSVAMFFDRAADRLSGFDDTDADRYTSYVDPEADNEPHEDYGC
jgi:hypothetical protein